MTIAALVGSIIAIIGVLYTILHHSTKIEAKVDILWEMHMEQARLNLKKGGKMQKASDYKLTSEGEALIPGHLKEQIKALMRGRKRNPGIPVEDIIKRLGGIPTLADCAERNDITITEMRVAVEAYIAHHSG